ncbi:MAG: hypothetical protein WA374_10380, partial [Acidobacteriaceae bacterium]
MAAARTAVLLAPDSLESRKSLAGLLLQAGDVAGALMHYQIAARNAPPGDIAIIAGLAQALTAAGLHEDAASACREAEAAGCATAADRERLRTALAPRPAPSSETLALARRLLEEGQHRATAGQATQALEAYR